MVEIDQYKVGKDSRFVIEESVGHVFEIPFKESKLGTTVRGSWRHCMASDKT